MKAIKVIVVLMCVAGLALSMVGMTGCSKGKYSKDDCVKASMDVAKKAIPAGVTVDEAPIKKAAEEACKICEKKSAECDKVVDELKKK